MKKTSLLLTLLVVTFLFSNAYAGSDSPEILSDNANSESIEMGTGTNLPEADNTTAEITSSSALISDEKQDALAGLTPIQAVIPVQSVELSYPITLEHFAGYSEPQLRTKPAYMQSYNQSARKNRSFLKKNIFIITAVNAIIATGVGTMLMKSDNDNYKIGAAGI
jgi:hypothetical protein